MWGISALFSGGENQSSAREAPRGNAHREPTYNIDHALSTIHLQEPPTVLRSSETPLEQEAIEIAATKLLLSAYFDIVRKIIEDSVPKAIMHFLVNHAKRDLHNVLIQKLYRENIFKEMLRESREVAVKRKRTWETLQVLQQAFQGEQHLLDPSMDDCDARKMAIRLNENVDKAAEDARQDELR